MAALVTAERQDQDQLVRESAAKSLEKIRDVKYRPSLIAVLGTLAVGALGAIMLWEWLKRFAEHSDHSMPSHTAVPVG